MKKVISLLLFMLVLCLAGTAMADYLPGDTVTVYVSITSNPNEKAAGAVKVKASDSSVLIYQSAQKTMNVNGFAPQVDGASFSLMAYDLKSPIPTGAVGTVTYKIAADAAPGTYSINVSSAAFGVSGSKTVVVGKPACEHTWNAGEVTTAPTCEQPGEMTYTCSKCDVTKKEPIDSLGHDYDMENGVVTKEPTCVDAGVKTFYCKNDKTHVTTEPIPATEKHEWVESITKPATCTEDGEKLMKCSVCGLEDPQVIKAAGHTPSDTAVKVDPTCTENGSISYNCTVCGEKVDGEVLEAIGHEWDEGKVTTAPTCETVGEKTFTCKNDASHTRKEEVAALQHDWDDGVITTQPTCGNVGEKTFTCKNDASHTRKEEVAALEHKWDEGKVTTAPTCVDEGEKTFTCLNGCGETKKEKVEATGIHTPGADAVIVKPTCTKDGSETYNCTVCGEKVDGKVLPATGHTWGEWVVTTEPTCTKKGEQTAICQNDASHTKTESVKATGEHIWDEGKVTTEPTCTKDGKKTFTCTYGCGKTKTEKIAKLGHDYDEGVVTTPATCTKDGVKTYTCKNDPKHTKTEKVAKLGHDYDEGVVTTEATCTENGVKTYTCKNDASHTKTERINKLGHEWGEWVITKPVTEEEDGEQQRTCARCGLVETKRISHRADFYMNVCSAGIRFRDMENPLTDAWYMFTPVDLSVEGEQTFELVAGNIHKIGYVTVKVADGNVTVTYKLFNSLEVHMYEEFLAILPSLSSIEELDYEAMTTYEFGEPISIEETLGGDTKVLLVLRNRALYKHGAKGVDTFKNVGEEYDAFVEELKTLMD